MECHEKSGGESSGILPSIPGHVRYAAGRIKKEGVATLRNAVSGTCIEQERYQGLQVFFPRGFFLYIAF
jgi:hypothetical protein